jgi:PAS domain S-box-containing protein
MIYFLWDHLRRSVRQPSRQWFVKFLGMVLFAAAIGLAYYTVQTNRNFVVQYATNSARDYVSALQRYRNFYIEEFVPRTLKAGLPVRQDYKKNDVVFPLHGDVVVNQVVGDKRLDAGVSARSYGDASLISRKSIRQLDDFQQQALAYLKAYPDQQFVRQEMMDGGAVLRYAQADRMLTACVICHKKYPKSFKNELKVGDVAGVIEVLFPLSSIESETIGTLNITLMIQLFFVLSCTVVVWWVLRSARGAHTHVRESDDGRSAALQKQHLSDNKLNTIFESVPEAIVVSDGRGVIVQCNLATAEMFGYKPTELVGKNVHVLMPHMNRVAHDGYLRAYQETGQKKVMDRPRLVQAMRKNGDFFPARVLLNETRLGDSHFLIGVIQDHTGTQYAQDLLVEAKDKAEQANRLRGEFLANMSHEIRTPMNGILGMTEQAMNTEDPQTQKEYLSLARDSAGHLLHIINQILDFSKIEAKALELEYVATCPAQIFGHTARSLAQLAHGKGLKLDVLNDATLPEWVLLDPVRVRQVLTNLLGNAIKFTSHGSVVLAARASPHSQENMVNLEISVTDTGIGFDSSRVEALFSPFTQADASITRSYGGTGLGLAITKSLVELMQGQITVESRKGVGTCFSIQMPVRIADKAQALAIEMDIAHAVSSSTSLSVLVAEDHEINRKLADIMLRRMGHQFVLVDDGNQALEVLKKQHFDVVLMDVMMPVMDGLTALKSWREYEVKKKMPRTPVLMVTAHAMTGDKERFLAAGADGYVSKPMSESTLNKEIGRVVSGLATHK